MVGLSSKGTKILMSYEERTTGNKPELQRKFFEVKTRMQVLLYFNDDKQTSFMAK